MSLQIRPGYINPLTMMTGTKRSRALPDNSSPAVKTADLQTKQQQLQNALLLMRSTGTDSGVSTAEQQEKLQAELEEVTNELRAAQNDRPQAEKLSLAERAQGASTAPTAARCRVDTYEKQAKEVQSPGIYQVRRGRDSAYWISFVPYTE